MRALFLGLSLLAWAPAWAEGATPPDNDDERPGEARRPARPPEDQPMAPSDTPSTEATGDAPLKLTGEGTAPGAAHVEGAYAGVSIGGQGLPPHPPAMPVKGPQRLTWPGFQIRDGVPTVFLQTTGVPNYAVTESKGAIVVTLHGTKIQLRNNKRPLKVAEFGTPVTEISAKPHGKDVVVTIKHKGEAAHRERVEPSAGGYQLLLVELPGK